MCLYVIKVIAPKKKQNGTKIGLGLSANKMKLGFCVYVELLLTVLALAPKLNCSPAIEDKI